MDRIDLLRVFLRIATSGSFSQAAEQLGLPRATVSIAIRDLETRLGARLLNRSTRHVSLTRDGEQLLERAAALVAEMEELEQRFLAPGPAIAGRLRVDLPSRIARRVVAPALPEFLDRHPLVEIVLGSSDRLIDLVQEGVDCALRVGMLASHSVVARRIGAFERVNCASPAYLERHGTPRAPHELERHWAIHYGSRAAGRAASWEWVEAGEPRTRAMRSRVVADNAETHIAAALAGLGLVQVPLFDVRHHLQSGELVDLLPDARPAPMPVHLVYPHRRHLPRRVRAFLDWTSELLAPHLDPPARPMRNLTPAPDPGGACSSSPPPRARQPQGVHGSGSAGP